LAAGTPGNWLYDKAKKDKQQAHAQRRRVFDRLKV
jgi:hypothetical protein